MNIFDYVKKIKKRFTKTDVLSSIDTINAELTNLTIPLFKERLEWLVHNDSSLKSSLYKSDRDILVGEIAASKYIRPSNPFAMILAVLENTSEILNFVSGKMEKDTGIEFTGESLTAERVNLLQLVDLAGFVSTYSRLWLDLILSAESHHHNQTGSVTDLTKGSIMYLGENRKSFTHALSILATPVNKIDDLFKAIPDVVIAEASPMAIKSVIGDSTIDPLKLNLVQSKAWPPYLIGMVISDYNANRYKTAKEEAQFLELRIGRLKRQMENKDDPKLAAILEKRKGQLDTYRGRIKRMEDSVK